MGLSGSSEHPHVSEGAISCRHLLPYAHLDFQIEIKLGKTFQILTLLDTHDAYPWTQI